MWHSLKAIGGGGPQTEAAFKQSRGPEGQLYSALSLRRDLSSLIGLDSRPRLSPRAVRIGADTGISDLYISLVNAKDWSPSSELSASQPVQVFSISVPLSFSLYPWLGKRGGRILRTKSQRDRVVLVQPYRR